MVVASNRKTGMDWRRGHLIDTLKSLFLSHSRGFRRDFWNTATVILRHVFIINGPD